jgi:ribosomal protection tetracycline resistance protein
MKKLNIGIIAHVDAGKTTLTENILYLGGAISKTGRVDKGDTTTDSMAVERRRGISVRAAAASFEAGSIVYNIIDTPGHVDFVAEVERSLAVLDGVVLVISAVEGLQSQTRILMDTIREFGIPAVIFINKIDRKGADAVGIARQAGEYMGGRYVLTGRVTDSQKLFLFPEEEFMAQNGEILCSHDEGLLAMFVENKPISSELFYEKLYNYTRLGEIYPIFFGSALYGVGCAELFQALPVFLLAKEHDCNTPLSGVVFKVDTSGAERLVYVRFYKGSLKLREMVAYNGKEEKITRLSKLEGSKVVKCSMLEAGDIGIVYLKGLRVGDVLGETPPNIRKVSFARPTLNVEVMAGQPEQKRVLYEALVQLADEDPLLNLFSGNKLNLRLFGEVQKEILAELIQERCGIDVVFSETRTIYMETPSIKASIVAPIYRNRTPFAAGVGFSINPLNRGNGLKYIPKVSLGNLTKPFQNAVEEAVYETCKHGIFGWEITDCEIVFDYSDYDSPCSTPSDFRDIVPPVLMEAFAQSEMILLEPYLEYDLRIAAGAVSKALYDLSAMGAKIDDINPIGEMVRFTGTIPADACKSYGTKVSSYTEGLGIWLTKFKGFQDTLFEQSKVNVGEINPAANKAVYLLQKLGAQQA